jgi:hypothetical protein
MSRLAETAKISSMRRIMPLQRKVGRRREGAGSRRWLALLLMLAFAASAVLQVAGGSHAAFAASHAHPHSVAHDSGDQPCCPDQKGDTHDGLCAGVGGCSLCAPLTQQATFALPDGEPEHAEPTTAEAGGAPFRHFHPPKLSAHV